MSHLTDMEEHLGKIQNPRIQDYMKEALACYNASAYRGCILMSYISLFDDILQKLEAIKNVNKDANEIYNEVSKRIENQDVYENYLLEKLKSKSLISELDASHIETIKNRRNKSAHPSGHHPSAEEARFIYFEVISKFLSEASLGTKYVVDDLLERLRGKNFFTSFVINETCEVAKHELERINPLAYPYLISSLVEVISKENGHFKTNAILFLDDLSFINSEALNKLLVKMFIAPKISNEEFEDNCMSVISANPNILHTLDSVTLKRLANVLDTKIAQSKGSEIPNAISHPIYFINNICRSIGYKFIEDNFLEQFKSAIVSFPYRATLPKFIKNDAPKTLDYYLISLKEKASSSSFDVSNEFANNLKGMDAGLAAVSSDKDCLDFLARVVTASRNGSWSSQRVRDGKFGECPEIKKSAIKYMECNRDEADKLLEELVGFGFDSDRFTASYM